MTNTNTNETIKVTKESKMVNVPAYENFTKEEVLKDYHLVDFIGIYSLYEHNEYGDEVEMIATNGEFYVYTWESLRYTIDHIDDEYEIHRFKLMESKSAIINLLQKALNITSMGEHIKMTYDKDDNGEYVLMSDGTNRDKVDITADSGIALIRDVVNHSRLLN